VRCSRRGAYDGYNMMAGLLIRSQWRIVELGIKKWLARLGEPERSQWSSHLRWYEFKDVVAKAAMHESRSRLLPHATNT